MPSHTGFPRTNASGIALPTGLYDPAYEHDSCGVGFVARITAEPDHSIVEHAVSVLVNLEHRGAIGGGTIAPGGAAAPAAAGAPRATPPLCAVYDPPVFLIEGVLRRSGLGTEALRHPAPG